MTTKIQINYKEIEEEFKEKIKKNPTKNTQKPKTDEIQYILDRDKVSKIGIVISRCDISLQKIQEATQNLDRNTFTDGLVEKLFGILPDTENMKKLNSFLRKSLQLKFPHLAHQYDDFQIESQASKSAEFINKIDQILEKVNKIETFLIRLMMIPKLRERLKLLNMIYDFEFRSRVLKSSVNNFSEPFIQFHSSKNFNILLLMLLPPKK